MTTATTPSRDLASSFTKLAKLREDVLAGAHPRIKLPIAAIEQLKSFDDPSVKNPTVVPKAPAIVASAQVNGSPDRHVSDQGDLPETQSQLNGLSVLPSRSQPLPASENINQSATPQFLPFLLEKSPALVQAEERSKRQREQQENEKVLKEIISRRQRLERVLRAELEKHGAEDKPRNELKNWDGPLVMNVERLFEEASVIANASPRITKDVPVHAPASTQSSFDENSYYSSQVNERWSTGSEEGEVFSEADRQLTTGTGGGVKDALAARRLDASAAQKLSVTTAKPPHHVSAGADASGQLDNRPFRARGRQQGRDESYSPPSPGAFRKDGAGRQFQESVPRGPRAMQRPQQSRPSQQHRPDSEEYSPPSPAIPVAQNHIHAPAAPQPSRVSPLTTRYNAGPQSLTNGYRAQPQNHATKNDKRQNQVNKAANRQARTDQRNQRVQDSIDQQYSGRMPETLGIARKRGRGEEHEDIDYSHTAAPPPKRRELPSRSVHSPLPYIKPEPVSPPPLSTFSRRNTFQQAIPHRPNPPVDNDVVHDYPSPQSATFPKPQSAQRASHREFAGQYGIPQRQSRPSSRIPSLPAPSRRAAYETQDLRRVASLQSASHLRPQAMADPYDDSDPRYSPPYARTPVMDDVEYVPVARSRARYTPSASHPREYAGDSYSVQRAMPPPPKKRIIVLENGEEWLAVPNNAASRQSLDPDPVREPYSSPYRERRSPYRRPGPPAVTRPQREVIELDDDDEDDGYQPMPPPPRPMYRSRPVRSFPQQQRIYEDTIAEPRAASIQPYALPPHEEYERMAFSHGHAGSTPVYVPERGYSVRVDPMQHHRSSSMQRQPQYELR
ncbi:MAG: hypothetical protein Q9162_002524 [Coniocarpon cinnabarinum]